jgi:hypothetical protein
MQLYTSGLTEGEGDVSLDHIMVGEEGNRVSLDCVGSSYFISTEGPPTIKYDRLSDALHALANLVSQRESP